MYEIKFVNVGLGYSDFEIIRSFNARIPKSGITTLLGQNGSGKTTILRALIKYIEPKSGAIYFGKDNLADINIEELPSYVSYSPAELDDPIGLRVLNIISSAKRNREWISEEVALHLLEYLGIKDLSGRVFNQLSTGQKRLVLIARSIAADTPIILLDEPTSGLDPSNKQRILRVIRDMKRKGFSVIIATHDLDVALESDHIIAIKEGKLLASGPSNEIITNDILSDLYNASVKVETFKRRKIVLFERAD